MNPIVTSIERVTPAMAKRFLETSEGNRPISPASVESYADMMERGEWKVNGIPIIFDKNGHLIDGHHRLEALIKADVSVEMTITRGVEADVFTTIDCGRHRNLGQLLAMNGVENYNKVSGIVSVSIALERTGKIRQNNGAKIYKLSNDILYQKWKEYAEDYADCTRFAERCYKVAKILRTSWVGGLVFYLTHTGGYDVNFVKKFFSAACSIETSGINPADELKKVILRHDRKNNVAMTDEYLFALLTKAWNAYARGSIIGKLSYSPKQEDYPKLKLNPEK